MSLVHEALQKAEREKQRKAGVAPSTPAADPAAPGQIPTVRSPRMGQEGRRLTQLAFFPALVHHVRVLPRMSTNAAPGWKKRPDYRITTKPAGARIQVKFRGEVIADTKDAIRLEEGDYPAVYYFPRKDVRMERLVRASRETYCPYKGQASYFSLKDGPENAVWTYEQPYDEMLAIRGLLAFYPDKVDSIATTE